MQTAFDNNNKIVFQKPGFAKNNIMTLRKTRDDGMNRRINAIDLERILNGDIAYIEYANTLDLPLPDVEVIMLPHHVKRS